MPTSMTPRFPIVWSRPLRWAVVGFGLALVCPVGIAERLPGPPKGAGSSIKCSCRRGNWPHDGSLQGPGLERVKCGPNSPQSQLPMRITDVNRVECLTASPYRQTPVPVASGAYGSG